MTAEKHPARARRRRKKRGGRLIMAYALQIFIIVLLTVMIVLMVCGVIYIKERLEHTPDGELPSADASALKFFAVPAEPVVPDWIIQDILPVNDYSRPGTELSEVNGVVVHYTGNPGTTAEQNRSYFGHLAETKETYASSHFIIGIDGKIIQCVPLNEIAYCSNKRNGDTISIECCHSDDTGQFSQATLDSLTQLLNWLIKTYDLSRDDILRHYDVTGKECPYYFVRHPDAWAELLNSLDYNGT